MSNNELEKNAVAPSLSNAGLGTEPPYQDDELFVGYSANAKAWVVWLYKMDGLLAQQISAGFATRELAGIEMQRLLMPNAKVSGAVSPRPSRL